MNFKTIAFVLTSYTKIIRDLKLDSSFKCPLLEKHYEIQTDNKLTVTTV